MGERYRLRQRFRYTYDGPATDLVHRLVAVPPARHGGQVRLRHTLTVSAPAAAVRWDTDEAGNTVATVRVAEVPPVLDFGVDVLLERGPGALPPLDGRRWLAPGPLTAPDAAIRSAAADLLAAGPSDGFAARACAWVHERVRYVSGSTAVHTTAAAALAGGRGVCQDQAHLLVAVCRAAGVPARYVSGHLPGSGRTHAWAEVATPGGTQAWDPCHDRRADHDYVTIAVGRDYQEAAPTSGWYSGVARGELTTTTTVEVGPVGAEGEPATRPAEGRTSSAANSAG